MTDECEKCQYAGEKKPPGLIPIQSGTLRIDEDMYPCSYFHYYVIAHNVKNCKYRQEKEIPKRSGNDFLQRKSTKITHFQVK